MRSGRLKLSVSSLLTPHWFQAFVRLAVACLVPNQDARVRIPPNALPAPDIGGVHTRASHNLVGRPPETREYAGSIRPQAARAGRGQFREVGQVEWPRASEARERRFDSCLPD